MSGPLDVLRDEYPDLGWERSHGQEVVRIPAEEWLEFAREAKEAGFEMCTDVTAVDRMRSREERFEVVANIVSMSEPARLRMITTAPRVEPRVPSLTSIWPSANFAEREVFDMYGIEFEGHPDLTRILMPDDWEGYPLRKDYGVGAVPVQFKESHQVS